MVLYRWCVCACVHLLLKYNFNLVLIYYVYYCACYYLGYRERGGVTLGEDERGKGIRQVYNH